MKYRLLLIAATVIWGTSFVIMKDLTGYLYPAWLLAFRFAAAALVMAAIFIRKRALYFDKSHVVRGLAIGVALFAAYYTQTWGLTDTTPGKNAFLTATYCVIVPFMAWAVMKKRPTAFNLIATFLCLFGIGLISLSSDFSISFGDAMTLVCAFFYAVQIVMMSMLGDDHDATVLTMWQFVAVAVCSAVPALLFEPAPDWGAIPASCLPSMAYLAVACTAVALLFMNVGIKHVPPATAGLLLSFESVFGALFSVLLGAEALTPRLFAGFVAVFASVVVSEYLPEKFKPQKASE